MYNFLLLNREDKEEKKRSWSLQPRHTELNSLHYLSIPEEISELEVEQAPVVQTMDSDVHTERSLSSV